MTTAFSTGPGLFACSAGENSDPNVPEGFMRFYIARLEAYDLPIGNPNEAAKNFKILAPMCEGKPDIATAMIALHAALSLALPHLRHHSRKG